MRSILKIRSLDESLHSDRVEVQAKLFRRRLCRQLSSIDRLRKYPGDDFQSISSKDEDSISVCFSHVEVREHFICIGTNPAVVNGPPLSIEWDCTKQKRYYFDDFEFYRQDKRRDRSKLRLTDKEREDMLLRQGYSIKDVKSGARQARVAKIQRLQTIENFRKAKLEEKFERFLKSSTNLIMRKRKRKERKMTSVARYLSQLDSTKSALKEKEEELEDIAFIMNSPNLAEQRVHEEPSSSWHYRPRDAIIATEDDDVDIFSDHLIDDSDTVIEDSCWFFPFGSMLVNIFHQHWGENNAFYT